MKTSRSTRSFRDQRGSVLLVALIFAAVVALSLTSYIKLANTTSNISYRSHYAGVAMNAAESGLEHAMWSIKKQKDGVNTAWTDWDTSSGSSARRTFDLGTVSGGGSVAVKVYVNDRTLATSAPFAIARAIVTPVTGSPVEKWIKISLSQRSFFTNGLVAEDGITFSGNNAYVDSYDSRLGDYDADLGGGKKNRNARGTAGSASVAIDSLNVGNADIYGGVSIGTSNYSGLKVGTQGKVTGDFNAAGGTIDYSRVATNFTANFAAVTAPSTASTYLGDINTNITLPDDTANDAKVTDKNGIVTYYYTADSINLNGSALSIASGYNVVVTVTGGVSVSGNDGTIAVNGTATDQGTLNLFVAGNVTIAGKGAANEVTKTTTQQVSTTKKVQGQWVTTTETVTTTTTTMGSPANFKLWGTGDTSQIIKIAGNGKLSGVVYAPKAAIEAKGGGNDGGLFGAFIGKTVKMTGNEGFHFDEALADLDSNEPLGIDNWDEFVSSVDRASLGNLMDF